MLNASVDTCNKFLPHIELNISNLEMDVKISDL